MKDVKRIQAFINYGKPAMLFVQVMLTEGDNSDHRKPAHVYRRYIECSFDRVKRPRQLNLFNQVKVKYVKRYKGRERGDEQMFPIFSNRLPKDRIGIAYHSIKEKQKIESKECPIVNQRVCFFREIWTQNYLCDTIEGSWNKK